MRKPFTILSLIALFFVAGALSLAQSPGLGDVKTVYLWPMRYSLDQYLAEQLSGEGPFQVVVDPKLADAIVTERIDAPFLAAMDELFPRPDSKPAKAETEDADSASADGNLLPPRPINRPMARPEGTVFLVHSASRKVLWSTFIKPKEASPKKLHQQARGIVNRLNKSRTTLGEL